MKTETPKPAGLEQYALSKLKTVQRWADAEAAHKEADEILCRVLNELGYGDVVEEWRQVRKWYA